METYISYLIILLIVTFSLAAVITLYSSSLKLVNSARGAAQLYYSASLCGYTLFVSNDGDEKVTLQRVIVLDATRDRRVVLNVWRAVPPHSVATIDLRDALESNNIDVAKVYVVVNGETREAVPACG